MNPRKEADSGAG